MVARRNDNVSRGWGWLMAFGLTVAAAACSRTDSSHGTTADAEGANATARTAVETSVTTGAATGTDGSVDLPSPNGAAASTGTENESDQSDQPQQVSGAFLTGIGPAPEYPASAGMESYGAGMFDPKTHVKYLGGMIDVAVALTPRKGQPVQPTLVAAPATSAWNVYFQLPKGAIAGYVSAEFTAQPEVMAGAEPGSGTATGTGTGNEQSAPASLTADPTSSFTFQPAAPSASQAQTALPTQVSAPGLPPPHS